MGNDIPRAGTAGFIFLALQYTKNNLKIKEDLKRKNLTIRLALESTDFYPAALLDFKEGTIFIEALSKEECQDKSKWDAKMISTAEGFLAYFMGYIGTIRPMLTGKISAIGLLKLTKLIWFIKANQWFFGPNRSYAKGVFYRMYNHPN